MPLIALDPRLIRYELRDGVRYLVRVANLVAAQGILFLCPRCWATNGNSAVGTHAIEVTFADRGVPDDQGSHGNGGQPTRWMVTGSSFADLSTHPSIQLIGGCNWHGFITNGEVR